VVGVHLSGVIRNLVREGELYVFSKICESHTVTYPTKYKILAVKKSFRGSIPPISSLITLMAHLDTNRHCSNGLISFIWECCDLNILVIHINPSIWIICKVGPIIINTSSNITSIFYYCKTIFKDFYPYR